MNWVNLVVGLIGFVLFVIIILIARREAQKGFKRK